jgi:hypothetical protein
MDITLKSGRRSLERMDLYVAAARRPIKHRVSSHLDPASYEPEPPYHAVARGHDRTTLCGEPIQDSLYAFPDSSYDYEASYARCPKCEAKVQR